MNQANINTQTYWDGVYRGEWESGEATGHDYSRDYGPIHDAVIKVIPEGSSVLDIACGPGLLCRKIKERVASARVLGVDFSQYAIERNRLRDLDLDIEYQCLDLRNALGSIARQFDVVCMCEILEHLEEPARVVRTAMDLLKTNGRLIITCPHDDQIPDPEHLRFWGHDDLFHLLAPYGDTVSFVHFPPPYFHIWMMAYVNKKPMNANLGGWN